MGKLVTIFVTALILSACSNTASSSKVAGLYTGYETGSWYQFSKSCSAQLCPAY